MARVLVTGATGFVGSYLVDALTERGDDVVCLTRPTSNTAHLKKHDVRLVHGDINDLDSIKAAAAGVEIVYHVAALVSALSKEAFFRVNSEGTRLVAEACAAQPNPPVLLYVSSLAASRPATNGELICESDSCRPTSDYGQSKRSGELAVAALADRVPVTIIRPPIVFGGRDPSTAKLFAPIGRFGVYFVPGWRHGRRYSLIHSAELVNAMILAATRGQRIDVSDAEMDSFRGGCYFVAFDEQPTMAELGSLIARSFGRRFVPKFPVPDLWVKSLGRFNQLACRLRNSSPALGIDRVRDLTAGSWVCSNNKIKSELGYSLVATLPERLRETAEWFKNEGWR